MGAPILGLVGLAARAGGVTFGVPLTLEAMRSGKDGRRPLLVLAASDVSENTRKKITDKTAFYGVPLHWLDESTEALANAVGKRGSLLSAVGITEPHLAQEIAKRLQESRK